MTNSNLVMWGPTVLPYLLSCNIPNTHKNFTPAAVSLVEDDCEKVSNHLNVIFETEKKEKKFAVCAKGHSFPEVDLSIKLLEWIEVNHALGAQPVIYYFHNHPNIIKVCQNIVKLRSRSSPSKL